MTRATPSLRSHDDVLDFCTHININIQLMQRILFSLRTHTLANSD